MILRTLVLMFVLSINLIPTLSAGCDRGRNLVALTGGAAGIAGIAGPSGAPGILDFSDFFALMPSDNLADIAAGSAVAFPQISGTSGVIVHATPSSFILPAIGTYLIEFQVSVTSAAQLMLRLNGGLVATAVFGRETGSDQIIGITLLTTTIANSVLEVINPPGNSPALDITSFAGGPTPVSAHLTITRLR